MFNLDSGATIVYALLGSGLLLGFAAGLGCGAWWF